MSKITIGEANGKALKLDIELLIPSRLLIQANSGGGKSWLLRRLAEQLWGKVQTIILDPEGEFYTIREKFGYVLVGQGGETPADVRSAAMLAERFLTLKASAVCDLYEAFRSHPMQRRQWVRTFLNALLDAPRALWHPLVVIVDEAHKFCPQETPKAASMQDREIIGGCKDAMIALSTTGRKRGFCPVWATQRLAKLDKDASAEFFNRLVGMTIEDVDVDRAADLMSVSKEDKHDFRQSLRTLNPGQFYAFGRAISIDRVLVDVGPVETHHPETGAAAKTSEPPPMPDEVKRFLPQLADLPKEVEQKQKTEAELRAEIRTLQTEVRTLKSAAPAPSKADDAAITRATSRAVKEATQPLVRQCAEFKRLAGLAKESLNKAASAIEAISLTEVSAPAVPDIAAIPVTVPIPRLNPVVAYAKQRFAKIPELGNGDLSRPQLELLRRLAEFLAIGRDRVNLSWLAASLSTTVRARGFEENMRRVRQLGFIEISNGKASITPDGMSQAGIVEPVSGEQLRARVKEMLSTPQAQMLSNLEVAYPTSVAVEDLANMFGTTVRARGFEENLRTLRSNELVTVASGTVKAADWLFLQ